MKKGFIREPNTPPAPKWSFTVPEWTKEAACVPYYSDGIDYWYAYDYFPALREEAKAVCDGCPVLQLCRDHGDEMEATSRNEDGVLQFSSERNYGILAGETPTERRRRREEQYG